MKKSALLSFCFLFVISCCHSKTKDLNPQPNSYKVNPKIINIYNSSVAVSKEDGRSFGSGTTLKHNRGEKLIVITAAHVVNKEDVKYFVSLPYLKELIAVNVKKIDEKLDLAILESVNVMKENGAYVLISKKAYVGDKVWAIGCPLGDKFVVSSGNISNISTNDKDVEVIRTTSPIFFGNSGGGLFLNGELVGVMSSAQMLVLKNSIIVVPGAGFAISYNVVSKFLQK